MVNEHSEVTVLPSGCWQGHCEEMWAVASHPSEPQFVTAGYDQWVSAWHADRHRRLWMTQIEVERTELCQIRLGDYQFCFIAQS